jgi:hypothetical protein
MAPLLIGAIGSWLRRSDGLEVNNNETGQFINCPKRTTVTPLRSWRSEGITSTQAG